MEPLLINIDFQKTVAEQADQERNSDSTLKK